MGRLAEGYSGSDIAVVVREALMEPLRKCQVAKQFVTDQEGNYHPCVEYPNCLYCPMALNAPYAREAANNDTTCSRCHAKRLTLYEVPPEKLTVPLIIYADFEKALNRAHSSVGVDELQRFVSWTSEF
eukprot:gene34016-45588_t